jgi:hypothetical protein
MTREEYIAKHAPTDESDSNDLQPRQTSADFADDWRLAALIPTQANAGGDARLGRQTDGDR